MNKCQDRRQYGLWCTLEVGFNLRSTSPAIAFSKYFAHRKKNLSPGNMNWLGFCASCTRSFVSRLKGVKKKMPVVLTGADAYCVNGVFCKRYSFLHAITASVKTKVFLFTRKNRQKAQYRRTIKGKDSSFSCSRSEGKAYFVAAVFVQPCNFPLCAFPYCELYWQKDTMNETLTLGGSCLLVFLQMCSMKVSLFASP